MSARQMHLFLMPIGSGGHVAAWRHPLAAGDNPHTLKHWRHLAETAERGKFDAVFIADAQGFRPVPGKASFSRLDTPRLDPVTTLAAMAATTARVGLIATLSTSYNEPYSAARRLATLDHLSEGRAGWNVVTSTTENEAHNFGREAHFGHGERYARAAEFIQVAKGLWDTWEDGALLADAVSGRFIDADRVHALRHEGAEFKVEGPLTMARPPQGHPVIVQAGASADGLALAAATAEAVFTSHPMLSSAVKFTADLKDRVEAAGRERDSLKILTAIQPIIADTREEAEAIKAELDALIHPELALAMLGMQFGGFDFTPFDPDGPLPSIPANNASQGSQKRFIDQAREENLSLIQLARRCAAGRTAFPATGTAADVAATIAEWFEAGAADGFVIAPAILPAMLDRFVDEVVPILQDKGLFRRDYAGTTLRDHLGLARPAAVTTGLEPEIWQS